MATNLSVADIWSDVLAVRERSPLVYSITNLVAINFNANMLLAAAAQRGIPSVLDPVGAGATPYRNQTLEGLRAGADSLAVVSALCAADDPQAAAVGLRGMCDAALKVPG